jgi:cytochrome P450
VGCYVVTHPDDIEHVLVGNARNYVKGAGFDVVRILLGGGLIASDGELWKSQRQLMRPGFRRGAIAALATYVNEAADAMERRFTDAVSAGRVTSAARMASDYALDSILGCIFGPDMEWIRAEGDAFAALMREHKRDLRFAAKFRALGGIVRRAAEQRRAVDGPPNDLLGFLLSARDKDGAPMSLGQLVDEVLTLIVAGHETTESVLTWALYLLAGCQEAQQRLCSETIDFGHAGVAELADVEKLDFLGQVIRETMRLYPPGWLFTRRALATDQLRGVPIPAGADVHVCPYLTHRHSEFWQSPGEFQPERFSAEAVAERHRFAFIPFGAGGRRCIGETLAMFEMRVLLRRLARRFHLSRVDAAEPPALELGVNLRPKGPMNLSVSLRCAPE